MSEPTSKRYTDGTYLADNPGWHEYGAAWKARKVAEALKRHGLSPKTVAEVGCGAGGILASLQERLSGDVVLSGFDISPQAIEIAKGRSNARLSYACTNFLERTEAFDLLMAMDVFEHVEDYFSFLRALRGRAKQHVFHIPLELSSYTLYRHRSLLQTRARVGHLHFFWKELALESLRDCGYRVLSTTYTSPPGEPQPDLDLAPAKSREASLVNAVSKVVYRLNPDAAIRWFGGSSILVVAEPAPA
jgi:SAM-dependent methyltransferase